MQQPPSSSESPLPRRPGGEQPTEFSRTLDGVTLVGFEWAGDGPPIVMAHGTGFHARLWDEIARMLPGRRVIALDLRGHGRSSKVEPYAWVRMSADTTWLIEQLDLHDVIGVGHSMGGYTMADTALSAQERFAGLVLVDPTIFRPRSMPTAGSLDFVARRRNEWASPDEMVERFAPRFPFNAWWPQILRDYATYGLLPAPSGEGYVLACPPNVEAAVYAARDASGADLHEHLDEITVPVRVLRARHADPDEKPAPFTTSPTMPDLASSLGNATDVLLPHLSHFIPMEAPDLVARHIIEVADAV